MFTKESTVVILASIIAHKTRVESKIILGNISYSQLNAVMVLDLDNLVIMWIYKVV